MARRLDYRSPGFAGIRNDPEAIKYYRRAAVQGHPGAQCNLAVALEAGLGGAFDPDEAAQWYKSSAEGGHLTGMYNYACVLRSGIGIQQDAEGAQTWMQKAAEAEHPMAMFSWASICEKEGDLEGMRKWLILSAEAGDIEAQFRLGVAMVDGVVLEQDVPGGIEWLRKAAEQGHKDAQVRLAELLREAGGTENEAEAQQWSQRSQTSVGTGKHQVLRNASTEVFLNGSPVSPNIQVSAAVNEPSIVMHDVPLSPRSHSSSVSGVLPNLG